MECSKLVIIFNFSNYKLAFISLIVLIVLMTTLMTNVKN